MTDYNSLQGRIIALELLVRRVLALVLSDTLGTAEEFAPMRRSFIASLQNVERAFGDEEDEIWEGAMVALEQHLDEIETSLRKALS
ncbi:hypothetical protein [Mesorhizobium sp. WSM2239]|uniref:Uncharacterized protein n=2 Tax=unclassified Mesorhizobium TaxID=325217 RepID=A0AAU8D695_9HYPH